MMNRIIALIGICFLLPLSSTAAPGSSAIEESMRSNGKIYVVFLVLATIFAGIILFLINLDRRIRKMEKNKQS